MIAVARAAPIEQISPIISRAWWCHVSEMIGERCRCGTAAAGASLFGQAPIAS